MCVIYEKTVPKREIKINLDEMYINNEIEMKNVKENIGNGECFAVPISKSIKTVEQIECVFGIFVKPLMESDNAFWANGGGAGEAADDDGPFEDQLLDFRVDDIRTMYRTSRMALHTPNLSHRYTVNLGKIDPPGLFLNRRVFVEPTKNGSGGGARNYHALLYAVASKNRRHFDYASSLFYEKIFVGYAPLVKIKSGQTEEGEASTSTKEEAEEEAKQRQNQLTEYHLSIPINAGRLFKHKIWNLKLEIFYFEQEQGNNLIDGNENATKRGEAENATNDCPICLDNLKSEKLTMQFHEDLNENCQV
ncbi:hypothetical protein niasHS_000451 [Heterodera schachtii]|uniref:Uncharacterized protein n=1 Tax=Heterodera schachtii TaxID=97005 RepID=A0ABD2K7V8_HETSC